MIETNRIVAARRSAPKDQLIPTLVPLVDAFHHGFRSEVCQTFPSLIAGWVVRVGPRTITEVWQTALYERPGPRQPKQRGA